MKNIRFLTFLLLPFFLFAQKDYKNYEDYFPSSTCGEIIHYEYYSVSYCDQNKSSEWAIYSLDREKIYNLKKYPRPNNFRKDTNGKGSSLENYRKSGFDRGHLVPARDMSFNEVALSESFFMTNISPQRQGLNRGAWRKLENEIIKRSKDWKNNKGKVVIITGQYSGYETIGEDKIIVPEFFYKIFVDVEKNRSISFLIPNKKVVKNLKSYVVPIGLIESLTGVDFFYRLDDHTEYILENLETGKINWDESDILNDQSLKRKVNFEGDLAVDAAGWLEQQTDDNEVFSNNRNALVIGNTDYDSNQLDLINPINDARLISKTLNQLGFNVKLKKDLNKKQLIETLKEFYKVQTQSDVSIIYYAGHAFQNKNGDSYLIPTDVSGGNNLENEAVNLNNILKLFDTKKPNLVILDACRELNQSGLSKPSIKDPVNTKLAYSTSFGKLASDDVEKNNTIYTSALSSFFKLEGLSVRDIFHNTSKMVMEKTNETQVPAHYFGVNIEDFKFSKTDN